MRCSLRSPVFTSPAPLTHLCLLAASLTACGKSQESTSSRSSKAKPDAVAEGDQAEQSERQSLGLLLPTNDFIWPSDDAIFIDASRRAYLSRAQEAVDKVKETCRQDICDTPVMAGGKLTRVVYFKEAKTYELSNKHCFLTSPRPEDPDMIVIEGQGLDKTVLSWNSGLYNTVVTPPAKVAENPCGGFAIGAAVGPTSGTQVSTRPGTIVVRHLTLKGGYEPWTATSTGRTPKYHSISPPGESPAWTAGSIRDQWQKGMLSRYKGNHIHAESVAVKGFYYGMAAEDEATAWGYRVHVSDAGDAGFFAYTGGQLQVDDSEARDAADVVRDLGFGMVAEGLSHVGPDSFKTCNDDIKANDDKRRYTQDPSVWSAKRETDRWNCAMHFSYYLPANKRSVLKANNSFAHANLKGGFLTNLGAGLSASDCKSFAHVASPHVLDDASAVNPNVYQPGYTGTGFGFLARHLAEMRVTGAMAYENYVGFEAIFDASMIAEKARAWSNHHYGFHAARYGRINAKLSQAYASRNEKSILLDQRHHYSVDPTSGIDVAYVWLMQASNPPQPWCVWPLVDNVCPHRVAPDYSSNPSANFNVRLNALPIGWGLYYRQ